MTDPIDSANGMAQFTNDLALHQHRLERQYEASLQQVVDGAVECLDCDDAIPADRLAALPNCVRCISCQTMHEIRERQ